MLTAGLGFSDSPLVPRMLHIWHYRTNFDWILFLSLLQHQVLYCWT